jgi:hypothetical protein
LINGKLKKIVVIYLKLQILTLLRIMNKNMIRNEFNMKFAVPASDGAEEYSNLKYNLEDKPWAKFLRI